MGHFPVTYAVFGDFGPKSQIFDYVISKHLILQMFTKSKSDGPIKVVISARFKAG